jgi:dihydrolipoamide dehydrogenase
MTTAKKYDLIVIGSGPGGYVAAIRAAQLGFHVACIEKESTLGGTCLNVGCIPSKTLLQSTEYYTKMDKHRESYGITFDNLGFDFSQMMDRKNSVVSSLTTGISGLFKKNKIESIQGTGRLVSPHQVEVTHGKEKQVLEATHIMLATGSEPIQLPFLPFDEKTIVSSTGALSLTKVPRKLIVIGAGVIGVELASVYSRLGSEVVVVEMLDFICPTLDSAMSKMLLQILKKQGMTFHLGMQVTGVERKGSELILSMKHGEEVSQESGDVILVAVGRKPYSTGLGLKEIGVVTNHRGFVTVDDRFRTNIPSILAIGDLVDGSMLAHRASEEGVVAVELLAGLHPHINYLAIPNVIYTHPEVAAVGLTEQEVKEAGLAVKIGSFFFKANARARCSGDDDGMVKVIGEEKSGRLIGLHIIGQHASELIAEGVLAIEKKATLQEIAAAPHAHPTLSEAIKEACLSALGKVIHS